MHFWSEDTIFIPVFSSRKKDGVTAKKRVGVCASAIFYVLGVIHMEVGVPTPGFAHLLPAIKDLESCRNQVGGVVRVEQMISSLD